MNKQESIAFDNGFEYALHVLRELGVDVDSLMKKV